GGVVWAEPALLAPQVVADLLIATLPREHLGDIGGVVAQPLPGDPVATGAGQVDEVFVAGETPGRPGDPVATGAGQGDEVVVAGEAAVDHGDDPAQPPAAQVILHLLDDRHV